VGLWGRRGGGRGGELGVQPVFARGLHDHGERSQRHGLAVRRRAQFVNRLPGRAWEHVGEAQVRRPALAFEGDHDGALFELRAVLELLELAAAGLEFRLQLALLFLQVAPSAGQIAQGTGDELHRLGVFVRFDLAHDGVFGEFVEGEHANRVEVLGLGLEHGLLVVQRGNRVAQIADGRLGPTELVGQLDRLPSLPSLYVEIVEQLQDPETDLQNLAATIAKDIAMTAKLLKLVNSAYFGLRREITNCDEAVAYLGVNTLKTLVLTLHAFGQFEACCHNGVALEQIWAHSLEVAAAARRIAELEHAPVALAEQAFVAGMLHDAGQLILAANLPAQYAAVIQTARAAPAPLQVSEAEILGTTHAELGGYLLGLWGLPVPVVEAIALHHQPRFAIAPLFSALTAVHVADMQMPGMSGLELLVKVEALAPDTVCMMLTGNADQKTAVDALNCGHVFRFLNKPCGADTLIPMLEAARKQFELLTAERDLLERTLNGTIRLLTEVLASVYPQAFGRSEKVRDYARQYAQCFRLKQSWDLEAAALLVPIGYLTFPWALLEKSRAEHSLTSAENRLLDRLPDIGAHLLHHIPRLQSVAAIIRYQHKQYDGGGFPADRVAGEDIPLGARILEVLHDLARLESPRCDKSQALVAMQAHSGAYDPKVLANACACFDAPATPTAATQPLIRPCTLRELKVHQVLASNVITSDGLLVAAAGTVLTPIVLHRLRHFAELNPIQEPICVRDEHRSAVVPQ